MHTKTILHITTWYPNKLDEQLGVFVQKHIEKGFTFSKNIVLAIIPSSNNQLKDIELTFTIENNVTVIRVYYPENNVHKFLSLSIRNKAISLGINKVESLKNDIDLIQCHVAEVSLWIAFKYYSNKPVFLIEHWSGFIDGRFDNITFFIRKAIVKRMNKCQHIFVVSELLKKSVIEKGISVPISIIPNVIEYKSVKKGVTIPFTFGVVADLVDVVKNISGIIKAFSQLKKELKYNSTRLVIVGDGVDKIKLQNLVVSLALENEVEFKGRLNNDKVLSLIPDFDVVIVNSFKETYSMVTAESLLIGVPVISTKCGGPEQFIVPNVNGYLIEVDDSEALCQAMKHSIENESFKKYDVISSEISLKVDVTKLSSLIIDKINF